jgi:hypothetical protein
VRGEDTFIAIAAAVVVVDNQYSPKTHTTTGKHSTLLGMIHAKNATKAIQAMQT